jgi:chromosome segregation ATPase
MDQQIETFESKIRSAFKKVKQDVTVVKNYLKKQDELLKSVKKELSDTVSSNDFYKFTEKLSEKLDGLRTYYVSKDEFSKSNDKLEKEIVQLRTLLESASLKGLSAEIQSLKKDSEKLKKEGVSKKEYDKLLDDAEHNFKELAKEVAEAKSYEKDIQSLQNDVSTLMKALQEKEKPEKKTKAQEKEEAKFQSLVEETIHKSEAFDKELSSFKISIDRSIEELYSEISDLKKTSSKKAPEVDYQKEMQKEFEAQKKELSSLFDSQSRQIEKLGNEIKLKADESRVLERMEEEVQSIIEKADFIRVDELNQKIDEFNQAIEDLASQKEVQKSISAFEKESFSPLKKEITQMSKDHEAMRKILTRLEESTDSDSQRKLSAFELRLDKIEEALDSPATDSAKVEELSSLLKDLEEEQKMLISEISDISLKPAMNERIIQSMSKDVEELKERLEDMDLSMPRGKKGKDNDLEQLRTEVEFLRNNFVTQGDVDSTLNALSEEITELKTKSRKDPEMTKTYQDLLALQSDVSQIKKHLASKVVLLEAESDKYSSQIALLYEDMKRSLERQSFLERRLSDIESVNDQLANKERDARISYESAKEQLENTEKKLQEIEIESERKAKTQLTIQESTLQKENEGPGFFTRLWTGIANFFSRDDEEDEIERAQQDSTIEKKIDEASSEVEIEMEEKTSMRPLKDEDSGFTFFDEEAEEPKKKGKGRPSKKSTKDEDDELY